MILFFKGKSNLIAVDTQSELSPSDLEKLVWLFDEATLIASDYISGVYIGPRKEMITPWSTNAVEITQNMGIRSIVRIEEFFASQQDQPYFDPMLQVVYHGLNQQIFVINHQPEPILSIDDIATYSSREGLALSEDEIIYLNGVADKLGRKLTDSEVFGFSQVNSEHCRHKIFNGNFILMESKKSQHFSS